MVVLGSLLTGKVIWSLPNGVRIDKLNKELLVLMKKAGCVSMALEIEAAISIKQILMFFK